VRELIVYGAPRSAGHARALRYRWPGALQVLEVSWLDAPVRSARADPASLAPGVVRIAPGLRGAGTTSACVLAAVDAGGRSAAVAEQGRTCGRMPLDPRAAARAWSGVVRRRRAFGTASGAELRARWDAHWTGRGHESCAPPCSA